MGNVEIDRLSRLTIKKEDSNCGEDRVVDVVPITDAWLISSERKWEEVDAVLEGRLRDIQKTFTDFDQPTSAALAYGIRRPIGDNQARLLAYAELVDEYRVVRESHDSVSCRAREEYDEEKKQLQLRVKEKTLTRNRSRKWIAEMWKEKYEPKIAACSHNLQGSDQVLQLIYKKAAIDIFSVDRSTDGEQPLVALRLAKLASDVQSVFVGSKASEAFQQRNPLIFLLSGLASYLSTTQDKGLFVEGTYRQSAELVTTNKDSRTISQVLEMACSTEPGLVSERLRNLSKAYLYFLRAKASHFSRAKIIEDFPHLSLIYDLLNVAVHRGSVNVMASISSLVDEYYDPLLRSKEIEAELKQLMVAYKQRINKVNLDLSMVAALGMERTVKISSDDPPQLLLDFMRSREFRLCHGLRAFGLTASRLETTSHFANSQVVNRLARRFEEDLVEMMKTPDETGLNQIEHCAGRLDSVYLYSKIGVEQDLRAGLNALAGSTTYRSSQGRSAREQSRVMEEGLKPKDSPMSLVEKLDRLRLMLAQESLYPSEEKDLFDGTLAGYYLKVFYREWGQPEQETARENDFLWREVLDNSEWFVSPRGDRFPVAKDPQLEDLGIQAITFRIDKGRPREHGVTVDFSVGQKSLKFWLTIDRELVSFKRELAIFDPALKTRFVNVLLKRLYVVTSGLLSQETTVPQGEEGGPLSFEYRRAHYRYLISSDRRTITMESHGAQLHAEEIKKIYGIDIFREIERRRALGTLSQNQFLTFVREVAPTIRGRLILPNELQYDPVLIKIPK